VNVFATRPDAAGNETYLKLVEIFQTDPEVQEGLLESSGGTGVSVQTPVADLVESLAKVEADTKASKG
jgi:D-methionine transport system substrate-binding protein